MSQDLDEEQSPQGFGMTFTSVSIIILSIFVYLNSVATFEPGKRRKAIASIDANFPKIGEQHAVSIDGNFPIPQAVNGLKVISRSQRFGGVSERDTGGSVEIVRSERGVSLIIDCDQLFIGPELEATWLAILTSLSEEVVKEGWKIDVGVHESSDSGAWALSLNHAQALKTTLLKAGVPSRQLSVAAFGASRPLASNSTTVGQRLNRRVEIRLSDDQETEADR